MSALVFLGIAVGVSIVGSLIVAFRNRSRGVPDDGVESFSALMRALAPREDRSRDGGL